MKYVRKRVYEYMLSYLISSEIILLNLFLSIFSFTIDLGGIVISSLNIETNRKFESR